LTATPWILKENRNQIFDPSTYLEDQDGIKFPAKEFLNTPVLVTFIYTRCENINKCPAVAKQIGKLAELLKECGLGEKTKILVVTYDPDYDIPDVMKRYAVNHGIICGPNVRMIRTDGKQKEAMFKNMKVAVNYDGGRVNIHGIQLLLLDKSGCLSKSYHSMLWDNAKVLEDVKVVYLPE